ncbi:MAG: MaoC family dehydratase N-terminal domain-containing protein [SAR202 cluster bacterium]|nr:MaoC family dehydratase N-terminal domain-containing protein [SAR202 cluster bacterium]
MLDRSLIGKKYPSIVFKVEKQRLQFFAKATSQSDHIYFDEAYAISKGYPSLLAPPTFLTTVGHEQDKPYQYLDDLKIKMGRILHAKQGYTYYAPIYAGDTITMNSEISEMYDKKDGALQFVVLLGTYTNQSQVKVAEAISTLVVR